MASGVLYRAPVGRDAHGDAVDAHGEIVRMGEDSTEIGTVTGLVLGGPSWRPSNTRGDVMDSTGLVGVPVTELQPEHGDLLIIDGVRFKVHGPPQWASRGLVKTPPRYFWFAITAASN